MTEQDRKLSFQIRRMGLSWDLDAGTLIAFNVPSIAIWLDPSLLQLVQPLVQEVGVPLARLLAAYHSSLGTGEDYQQMITTLGATFQEGFLAWCDVVAESGWGKVELSVFDRAARRAVVTVKNPFELQMQRYAEERWGCPLLQGKIIGLFSHALGVNCWADEVGTTISESSSYVEFHVYPSERTINAELARLRLLQKAEEKRRLTERTRELRESEERQRAILASLSDVVFTLDKGGRFTSFHVPELAADHEPPQDVTGRTVREVFPADVADSLTATMERVLATGAPHSVSYARQRAGVERSFAATMSVLRDPDGTVAGVTAVARDVTERVAAERALAERLAIIESQAEAIRAMSTPILEVWNGVLAVPIIGAVGDRRAALITEDLLGAIARSGARFVILDLTGVESLGSATAGHFWKIIRAARLLGAECLLCGILPNVARSLSMLDKAVALEKTYGTMRSALESIVGASVRAPVR
jgi:rsbT co-antagonist protein RsbR